MGEKKKLPTASYIRELLCLVPSRNGKQTMRRTGAPIKYRKFKLKLNAF